MRIWLDKIGVGKKYRPEGWHRPLKRELKCRIEKKIFGVDSRETYDLRDTWYMWLYEHLKMYLKKASTIVDLEYHEIEWNGHQWTQKALIEEMLRRLEYALNPKSGYNEYDETQWNYVHQIEEIWAVVFPYLWW